MRALLVCNPKATTTSDRVRDVLIQALRSEAELDVAYTRRRGHGASIARQARTDGVDVVVALGGDGTVNEVVNGLLADGPSVHGSTRRAGTAVSSVPNVPALALVAGGSTNVFARALGLPTDWAEGTAVILDALREGRTRSIGLGKVATIGRAYGADPTGLTERYFTFCAGFGMDAEVIHRVERARLRGRKSTPLLYMQSIAGNYLFERDSRTPRIMIEGPEIDAYLRKLKSEDARPNRLRIGKLGRPGTDSSPGDSYITNRDLDDDALPAADQHTAADHNAADHNAADQRDDAGETIERVIDIDQLDGDDLLSLAVIQNTAPWTYIGERPIEANPEASFDLGLDLMAIRGMNVFGTTRTMAQLLAGRRAKDTGDIIGPHGKHVLRLHDLSEFTLRAKLPAGLQVDGDYLGERDEVRFTSVPDAIRVVC